MNFLLDYAPHIFYRIQIRRVGWPIKCADVVDLKEVHSRPTLMARCIIVLEYAPVSGKFRSLVGDQMLLQSVDVRGSVHSAWDMHHGSTAPTSRKAPTEQETLTKCSTA